MSELNSSPGSGEVSGWGHLTQYHKSGIHCPASYLRPLYSVYSLGTDCHKVIKFHDAFTDMARSKLPKTISETDSEGRYRNNICRAKTTITELIMANEWDWFFTGTLDPNLFDRFNLSRFKSALSQFMRDQRKKYSRGEAKTFRYVLVPEQHDNGAWHVHGVLSGVPHDALALFSGNVPQGLIDGGYMNWPDYQAKFGYCSLGMLRDKFACSFYIRKYISKGFAEDQLQRNEHLYYASLGLNRRVKVSDYFTGSNELESCLTNYSPWCESGYVQGKPWHFGFDGEMIVDPMELIFTSEDVREVVSDSYPDWEQMQFSLAQICEKGGYC